MADIPKGRCWNSTERNYAMSTSPVLVLLMLATLIGCGSNNPTITARKGRRVPPYLTGSKTHDVYTTDAGINPITWVDDKDRVVPIVNGQPTLNTDGTEKQ